MNINRFGENWLFDSYRMGRDKPQRGRIYLSYLAIGILSLLSVYILFIVAFFWLMAVLGMRRLTFKSWMASVLGVATPYWIQLGIGFIY